jgi:glycosyltransferase involved in cell wall biosynthesis
MTKESSDFRPNVVFVGAFGGVVGSKVVGGQIAACRGILESQAARSVRWMTVDSTMLSIPPPSLWRRAIGAARRVLLVLKLLWCERVDGLLVFSADDWSFLEKGCMAVAGRLRGVRVVLAPRSGMLIDDLDCGPAWRRTLWRLLFRAPHVIVCQSQSWADFFANRLERSADELPVIRNGIGVLGGETRLPVRAKGAKCRLLYLGWFESFKGPQVLAEAFLAIWQDHPELHLCICGSGTLEPEMRRLLAEPLAQGRAELPGWVTAEEKRVQIAAASCLVLPSLREGSPNALLEAMERGLPVIASGVGAVPEMLGNGGFGLVVPPSDPTALAVAIREVLALPEEAAVRARLAREHVRENHDMEKNAARWTELFINAGRKEVTGGSQP